MGKRYLRRLVTPVAVVAAFFGAYMLPEYWPDHAMASDAIRRHDTARLRTYLARGLKSEERSQWRSYLRRTLGRTTSVGVEDMPALGPAGESLLDYALGTCATASALVLVDAGADVSARTNGVGRCSAGRPDAGTRRWRRRCCAVVRMRPRRSQMAGACCGNRRISAGDSARSATR